MKKFGFILLILALCVFFSGCKEDERETIIVGSKDFTEQYILGNMLELYIKANTDFNVLYNDNMASHVIFAAINTGVVDLHVDYTGTIFGYYLNNSGNNDPNEVYEISARELMAQYDLRMLGLLGFNNSYNLAVRQDTADEFGLRTISDLARVSSGFIFGGSAEIINRSDGLPNLKIIYDMYFKEERIIYNEERYPAVANDEVQVSEVFTTDGLIAEYDLVVLEDDKNFFLPYHGVIVIRNELAEKHPGLVELLERLEGRLSDEVMRGLNYRVDVLGETPRSVAERFLRENGLI